MITPQKLLLIAALAFPVAGWSTEELSYTYLELDYVNLSIDEIDDDEDIIDDFDDGDGWAVQGSFAFTPMFFVFAGYSDTDSDASFSSDGTTFFSSSVDVQRLDIGLGLNKELDIDFFNRPDLVARIAYTDIDLDGFDFGGSSNPSLGDLDDDSSDGWFADVALRSQLVAWLEASGGVRYTDIQDADDFSFIGNLLFELSPSWGINLGVDAGDDISTWVLGVRYSFERS